VKSLKRNIFFGLACALSTAIGVKADILLSVGYYDLAPPASGNTNALPNPWYGSPNTTFLGSAAEATSSDPDESGILFTNTGTTAVTLNQGVTVKTGSNSFTLWDSLIGASGFSILPGHGVILSGTIADSFDGSDIPLSDSTISFSLNGTSYSAVDSNSILQGFPGGNETEPWTQIDDLLHSSGGGPSVPEPASLTLVSAGLLALAFRARRKRQ
jgi:hypothetical protein